MGRERKKSDSGGGEIPAWIVTYGDMMSLLLTFFILLAAFSTLNQEEFNKAMMSMQAALGVLELNNGMLTPAIQPPNQEPETAESELDEMAREIKKQLQVMAKDQEVSVAFDEDGGLKISLPSGLLFDRGQAQLRAEAYPVLNELGEILKDVPDAFIEVRGHTDDLPLEAGSPLGDNYELSYRRADAVARRLSQVNTVPINQFEITACGPSQPIATNDTPEGRQTNRRVELYVRGAFNRRTIENWRDKTRENPKAK